MLAVMDSRCNDCAFPFMWISDTPTEMTEIYEKWSTTYDKDLDDINYLAPKLVTKALAELYPHERQTIKVLDIGAGTGCVGVELQKLGFHTIDGLDPSQGMMEKARDTHAYTNLFCEFFTSEPTPGLNKDSYDVIISAGSLILNHLPADCFIEAVRLVKPGGYICILTRTEGTGSFYEPSYQDTFKAAIDQLKAERKLEEIKWEKVPYYLRKPTEGLLMAYKVLQ